MWVIVVTVVGLGSGPEIWCPGIRGSFCISLLDDSDVDLRLALVNMVAIAIGCSKSTHLWFSIFHIEELINTYISGFMVSQIRQDGSGGVVSARDRKITNVQA